MISDGDGCSCAVGAAVNADWAAFSQCLFDRWPPSEAAEALLPPELVYTLRSDGRGDRRTLAPLRDGFFGGGHAKFPAQLRERSLSPLVHLADVLLGAAQCVLSLLRMERTIKPWGQTPRIGNTKKADAPGGGSCSPLTHLQ